MTEEFVGSCVPLWVSILLRDPRTTMDDPQLSPGNYLIEISVKDTNGSLYKDYLNHEMFTVSPGTLRKKIPLIMTSQLVSSVPPAVGETVWEIHGA